jgi:hypothetical protein
VQATFNALEGAGMDLSDGALLLGGDGRYFNDLVSVRLCACSDVLRVASQGLFGDGGVKYACLYWMSTQSSHALPHRRTATCLS